MFSNNCLLCDIEIRYLAGGRCRQGERLRYWKKPGNDEIYVIFGRTRYLCKMYTYMNSFRVRVRGGGGGLGVGVGGRGGGGICNISQNARKFHFFGNNGRQGLLSLQLKEPTAPGYRFLTNIPCLFTAGINAWWTYLYARLTCTQGNQNCMQCMQCS